MDKVNYPPTSEGLADVLRRLRAPDGCPWDRKQTRESLSRHLAGETAELLDAIDRNAPADICDELGDVLMNIFLQILVAEEKGEFGFEEVWKNIIGKMIRRHVHISATPKRKLLKRSQNCGSKSRSRSAPPTPLRSVISEA